MLKINKLKSNTLQRLLQQSFSTKTASQRVRNFFELDPIFPDQKEDITSSSYTLKRLPVTTIFQEQQAMVKRKARVFGENIKNSLINSKLQKFKQEQQLRQNNLSKKEKSAEFDKELAEKILLDEELNIPLGLGFDMFVDDIKRRKFIKADNTFVIAIQSIYKILGFYSEDQLTQLHQESLITATKSNFYERARSIIINRIISELKQIKQKQSHDPTLLEKLMIDTSTDEFLNADLNDLSEQGNLYSKLESKLKENIVDRVALHLSKQNFDYKTQPKIDKKTFNKSKARQDILMNDDPYFSPVSELEFSQGEEFFEIERDNRDVKLQQTIVDGMTNQAIDYNLHHKEVKKKYYTKKVEMYYKYHQSFEQNNKRYNFLKQNDQIDEDLKSTLQSSNSFKYEPELNFKEIYDKIDYILENTPLYSKIQHEKIQGKNQFDPKYINRNINHEDFVWGTLTQHIDKIVPGLQYTDMDETYRQQQARKKDFFKNKDFQSEMFVQKQEQQIETQKTQTDYRRIRRDSEDIKTPTENDLKRSIDKYGRYLAKKIEEIEQINVKFTQPTVIDSINQNLQGTINNDNQLTEDQITEIEIYKNVKSQSYFYHYMKNELRYYSDRMSTALQRFNEEQIASTILQELIPYGKPRAVQKITQEIKMAKESFKGQAYGGGKRKTSHALAKVVEGTGQILVNGKSVAEYFPVFYRQTVIEPLLMTNALCQVDVKIWVHGGGFKGQAEASQQAISKAFAKVNSSFKKLFKEYGYLRTDYRQVERKHVGCYKARKKFPYVRR